MESEYCAIASTTQEIKVIRSLLIELGISVPAPMKILSNNLWTTLITRNPINHIKLKHVTIDLHFMRERIEIERLLVQYIAKEGQWMDILTKALSPKAFTTFKENMLESSHKFEGAYWTKVPFDYKFVNMLLDNSINKLL